MRDWQKDKMTNSPDHFLVCHDNAPLVVIADGGFKTPTELLVWYAGRYDFDLRKLTWCVVPTVRRHPEVDPATSDVELQADYDRLNDSAKNLESQNNKLRASAANGGGPCVYCDLTASELSKCRSGFPGCGRADDAMLCQHFGSALNEADLQAVVEPLRAGLQTGRRLSIEVTAGAVVVECDNDRAVAIKLSDALQSLRVGVWPCSSVVLESQALQQVKVDPATTSASRNSCWEPTAVSDTKVRDCVAEATKRLRQMQKCDSLPLVYGNGGKLGDDHSFDELRLRHLVDLQLVADTYLSLQIVHSYPNCVCPDCAEPIPLDVQPEQGCTNCGHVFCEPDSEVD